MENIGGKFFGMGALLLFFVVVPLSAVPPTQGGMDLTAAMPPSGHDPEATGRLTEDGTCMCTLEMPAVVICTDYQTQINSQKLREIQQQISKLTVDVNKLSELTNWHSQLFAAFDTNYTEVALTFDLLEGGQVLVTRVEIERLRSRIRNMRSILNTLQEWHGQSSNAAQLGRLQVMLNEVSNISGIMDVMGGQDTFGDVAALEREIQTLTNQLKTCSAQVADGAPNETPTEPPASASTLRPVATALPEPDSPDMSEPLPDLWPANKNQNSCGRLLRISEPYTVRGNLGTNGTWMRDPILNPGFVYFHRFRDPSSSSPDTYSSSTFTQFQSGMSIRSFQRGETHQITGVQFNIVECVVYNGSLFAYTSTQQRYQTSHEKVLTKIELSQTPTSFPTYSAGDVLARQRLSTSQLELAPYLPPASVPTMDLTVDEAGPWLLYGDSAGMLAVTELDHEKLRFKRTLHGSYPKNRMGNCFIVCRKVYCLNSYTDFDSRVSYYLDTETGIEGFTNIPFVIKYGSLSSIEYNPRDQMLYGWDNGHAVVYSLVFE